MSIKTQRYCIPNPNMYTKANTIYIKPDTTKHNFISNQIQICIPNQTQIYQTKHNLYQTRYNQTQIYQTRNSYCISIQTQMFQTKFQHTKPKRRLSQWKFCDCFNRECICKIFSYFTSVKIKILIKMCAWSIQAPWSALRLPYYLGKHNFI